MDDTTARARLVRRADRRLIAGVAGGLGDYFGVSAGWFRAGFVLATFAGGLGVVTYLLLWFVIPRQDLPRSAVQQTADHFPDAPAWIGLGLIGIGVLSLASQLGIHVGAVGWALVLIGVGFLLFRRADDAEVEPGPLPPAPAAAATDRTTVVVRRPRRTRERSPLGWLTLGLALAASGVVAVLRNAGSIDLTLAQALAIPLTILGVGLVVGAIVGRARWTVLLGLPLVLAVVAASAFTVPLNGRWTDTRVVRATQLHDSYVQSGGQITLDLARMDPSRLPSVIDVEMGAGTVEVHIPARGVRVEASVNIGAVSLHGTTGGVGASGSLGDPAATTVVHVHVDVGQVSAYVQRVHRVRRRTA